MILALKLKICFVNSKKVIILPRDEAQNLPSFDTGRKQSYFFQKGNCGKTEKKAKGLMLRG